MNNVQVRNTVKLLLDDYSQVFHNNYLLDRYINEAQLRLIRKAYQEGDERLLRPLYRTVDELQNGDLIEIEDLTPPTIFIAEVVLYPKVCKLYHKDTENEDLDDRRLYKLAHYMERGLYENQDYILTDFYSTFGRLYYTLDTYKDATNSDAQDQRHIIKFNVTDATPRDIRARFTYIKRPYKFGLTNPMVTPAAEYTLEIPAEYHPEVCFLAADLANSIDVLEMDRSSKAQLQQSGGIEISKIGV